RRDRFSMPASIAFAREFATPGSRRAAAGELRSRPTGFAWTALNYYGCRMRYRKLGRTGYEVSELGYGAWGIGGKQWKGGTDEESLAALMRAFELGLNFIDTALAYGDGHSERLVGGIVRNAPHRIYLATKVPPKNRLWPARPGIS